MGSRIRRSRKQSASPSLRPEEVVLFIDRSIGGKVIYQALSKAGFRVERLEDHFNQREKDEVWIRATSEKKWIILSKDKFIDNRLLVLQAVYESNARMFILTGGDMLVSEVVALLDQVRPVIVETISNLAAPFIVKITRKGEFKPVPMEEKLRLAGLL